MTRLFGTDGIRGIANVDLKPTLAFALGRATAWHLLGGNGQLLVGQDTRRSGDMLVAGLVCGATSMGVDVHRLGVCPTPALAYVTGGLDYAAGRHGVGVPQSGRRQRPQGARWPGPEAR